MLFIPREFDYKAYGIQAMVAETLAMERRIPGWRQGLIPFAKDVDGNFLVRTVQSYHLFISIPIQQREYFWL